MKLIITIINETIAPGLIEILVKRGFRVTGMSSSGGFLKKGNKTIISGVEDDEVQLITQLIKEYAEKKQLDRIKDEANISKKKAGEESLATIFVLPVEKMIRC